MKVFRADIWIAATAYVKAESAEEAAALVNGLDFDGITLDEQTIYDEFEISGARFDSEYLPDLSLSPAMTIYSRRMDGEMTNHRLMIADDMEEAE